LVSSKKYLSEKAQALRKEEDLPSKVQIMKKMEHIFLIRKWKMKK